MAWIPVGNVKGPEGPPGAGASMPDGPPRSVYSTDEFGIPGWMPEKRLEGAVAWLASNWSTPNTTGTYTIPFGDAEQYGQLMWDLDEPTRMYARRDGYYIITGGFSIAVGTVGPKKLRFKKNGGLPASPNRPYDLTGRVSAQSMGGGSAEPLDFSAVSAPVLLFAGEFIEMTVFGQGSTTLQAGGRASWMSMEFLG